jgi:acyl carrier protein
MSATIKIVKEVLAHLRADPRMVDTLSDTADLINDVSLDSLELLQLMLEVESRLAVRIDFEKLEYSDLSSIAVLANFLDAMPSTHVSNAGGGS